MFQKPIMVRALELAATGQYKTMTAVKMAMRSEGYVQLDSHFAGQGARRQIRQAIKVAREANLAPEA